METRRLAKNLFPFGLALSLILGIARGGAAIQLRVTNDICAIQPCPQPVPVPTTVEAGQLFSVIVIAADAGRASDPDYRGTVFFTSTDPAATIPDSYTFAKADGGRKEFFAVLRSAGPQTITVTDSTGLAPGSLTLTVTGSLSDIPTLERPLMVALTLLLAAVGVWSLRLLRAG
jgi:hypothetical protein